MGCDHTGPEDVIGKAEELLASERREIVDGLRYGWGENVDTMWRSIYIEIERREGNWIVTRIDRSNEPMDEARLGIRELDRSAANASRSGTRVSDG